MNKAWSLAGRGLFWFIWPVSYVYFSRSAPRSRIIVTSQDKVLLVKGWLGKGHWILPGGGIQTGETPAQGALRELLEETGVNLALSQLKRIGGGKADEYGLKFDYITFWAELNRPTKPHVQTLELIDAAWLPLTNIMRQPDLSPETRRILSSWSRQRRFTS